MASAGQISAESVEVFGLPAGEYGSLNADTNPTLIYDEADKEPSHIVSNSTAGGADKAVTLGNDTKIAGDVKASGEIEVDASAQIQGNLLPNSAEQNLPNVSIEAYDPAGEPDTYNWTGSPGPDGRPVLVGRSRYDGDLTIGDLDMAEGLLYVDGDVTITGTVKGKGAIVATGKITVTGSMNTNADHAALVAKGDIKIHGNGPNSSKFQGLVYSEKSIDIAKTQIIGAAVSKDSAGTTKLEDVRAISVPELTKIEFEQHVTLGKAIERNRGSNSVLVVRESNGNYTRLSPDGDVEALKELASSLSTSDPEGSSWSVVVQDSSGFLPISSLPLRERTGAMDTQNLWGKYVLEHRDDNIDIVEIFDIDLNTLISLDVKLEMMYHTTVRSDLKDG